MVQDNVHSLYTVSASTMEPASVERKPDSCVAAKKKDTWQGRGQMPIRHMLKSVVWRLAWCDAFGGMERSLRQQLEAKQHCMLLPCALAIRNNNRLASACHTKFSFSVSCPAQTAHHKGGIACPLLVRLCDPAGTSIPQTVDNAARQSWTCGHTFRQQPHAVHPTGVRKA